MRTIDGAVLTPQSMIVVCWNAITRVNREIRILKPLLETSAFFDYRRMEEGGKASIDLSSLVNENTMLLVANDLRYEIDTKTREFRFPKREFVGRFPLAPWIEGGSEKSTSDRLHVFRIDSDGTHDVNFSVDSGDIVVKDSLHVVGVYAVSLDAQLRNELSNKTVNLRDIEESTGFDPGSNQADLAKLRSYLE